MKVSCEMQPAIQLWIARRNHEGERLEMQYEYGPEDGFRCYCCGHFLPTWEALDAIPYPYTNLDGLAWAMLDAEPHIICHPDGLKCEYPRRSQGIT